MLDVTKEVTYASSAALAAVAGAVHDLRTRRIPNRLTAGATACGLGLHLALGGWRGLGLAAVAGLLAGSAFFVFYLAGGMGAGDVKLMAASGCLAGLLALEDILLVTVACGALLALGIAFRHRQLGQLLANTWALAGHHRQHGLTAHAELNARNPAALRMPFAVPIAAGCLVHLGCAVGRV